MFRSLTAGLLIGGVVAAGGYHFWLDWKARNSAPTPTPTVTVTATVTPAPMAAPECACPTPTPCPVASGAVPEIDPAIILPAPGFPAEPERFVSNAEGEVRVKWNEVKGARRYHVEVTTLDGKPVSVVKTRRTVIYLRDLPVPPGVASIEYLVGVRTENGAKKTGELSERRKLLLKNISSLTAPEIKEIRVED